MHRVSLVTIVVFCIAGAGMARGVQADGAARSGAPDRASPKASRSKASEMPAVKPAPVQGLAPLKGPIHNPAIFQSLYKALLTTPLGWDTQRLQFVLDKVSKDSQTMYDSLVVYQKNANSCATRNYTIDDQKQAGCLGTDTLDQCSKKLFDHCFGAYKNDPFFKDRKDLLDSATWLDKKLDAYTAEVKAIPKPN